MNAEGSVETFTEKAASARIESAAVADCVGDEESVTRTPKLAVPAVVAVPAITPVDGFKVSPAGSAPLVIAQVYGVLPPFACSVAEYATPTVASAGVCAGSESAADCPLVVTLADNVAVCAGDEESAT